MLPAHRSEREREREREIKKDRQREREKEREREGEIVACTHKQKVRVCSKHSSFSQSVSMHHYIIYININ